MIVLCRQTGIWVTYKNGVYDITDFVSQHPGGEQIMLAAGSSVEPFWMLYGVHKSQQILDLLESMRIGTNLKSTFRISSTKSFIISGNITEQESQYYTKDMSDPYYNEPKRHKVLRVHSAKPFNAEPPSELLIQSFHTPKYIERFGLLLIVLNISVKYFMFEIICRCPRLTLILMSLKLRWRELTKF